MIISGDIGGTNIRLCLSGVLGSEKEPPWICQYKSSDYLSLERAIDEFLNDTGCPTKDIKAACFAVAGPIHEGEVKLTNLPWKVSIESLKSHLKIDVVELLNDFSALSYGLGALSSTDLVTLHMPSVPTQSMVRAVVGAGTGLGVSLLHGDLASPQVLSTEGGHIDFAPINDEQLSLLAYLKKDLSRVSVERVCSGYGLVNIYQFLIHTSMKAKNHQALSKQLKGSASDASLIGEYAQLHKDPVAIKAVEIFLEIYASVLGNVALMFLPLGGLYIAGGIAPNWMDHLQQEHFLQTIFNKGRMTGLLHQMPIHVITNTQVGLIGARCRAQYLLKQSEGVCLLKKP